MCITQSSTRRCLTLVSLVGVLALSLLLPGCVEDDTGPKFSEATLGTVNVSTGLTAADESPQYLDEYGLFYSTNRDDIVAITGQSYLSSPDSDAFTIRGSVVQTSVLTGGRQVGASESGTLNFAIPNVKPNTTYHFRFYTVGRDSDDTQWLRGLTVGSYTTRKSPHYVSKPAAPKTMYKGRSKTVYGYLKPRHTSGSTSKVRIYRYKRNSAGVYKKYDHVHARLSDYSSYSKYKKSFSFPSRGKWRIRAYAPEDAGHAADWSSYDYVTVR